MGPSYVVHGKWRVPPLLLWIVASWAVSLVALTGIGITIRLIWGALDANLIDSFPGYVIATLGLWATYTGLGALFVWVAMWIYWVQVERSSYIVRTGWFLILLLGMQYGAFVYALYLWNAGRIKAATSHRIARRAK